MDELGKNGCNNDVCSTALKIQSGDEANACTKRTQVMEDSGVDGGCKLITPASLLGPAAGFLSLIPTAYRAPIPSWKHEGDVASSFPRRNEKPDVRVWPLSASEEIMEEPVLRLH